MTSRINSFSDPNLFFFLSPMHARMQTDMQMQSMHIKYHTDFFPLFFFSYYKR